LPVYYHVIHRPRRPGRGCRSGRSAAVAWSWFASPSVASPVCRSGGLVSSGSRNLGMLPMVFGCLGERGGQAQAMPCMARIVMPDVPRSTNTVRASTA